MSTARTSKPQSWKQLGSSGRRRRHQDGAVAGRHDVGSLLLRDGPQGRERRRVEQGGVGADDRAVRQGGDRGLQVQHLPKRNRHHRAAAGRHLPAQLADALAVGTPAAAHVERRPHLEDVTSVERAGLLDARELEPQFGDRLLGPGDLRLPLRRARPREHRQVAAHDNGVLDERGVGQVVRGRHLADRPARAGQRLHVGVVLPHRQARVRRTALAMRDDALRHPAARAPDESDAFPHGANANRWRVKIA